MSADLHCHTKLSDGSLSVEEILGLAKRAGIETVAITDHDTLAGALKGKVIGERMGIKVIPGVELSSYDMVRKRKVHILAYLCREPARLEGICKKIAQERKKAALIMMQKVMRIYPITTDMVARRAQGSTNVYKQHMMHALMDAGYTDELYGDVYKRLFDPEFGEAYHAVEYPDVRMVLDLVHQAGGIAVLAHPGVYDSYDLMEELAAEKLLDGIEAYYPRSRANDAVGLSAFAKKENLLTTGGTDFHGMYGFRPLPLGSSTTPPVCLKELLNFKREKGE